MAMICKNCGAELSDGTKFCTSCGQKIEVENEYFNVGPEPSAPVVESPYKEESVNGNDSKAEEYNENDIYGSQMNSVDDKSNNLVLAIISLVCGILSILCCCFGYLGLIFSLVAVALGIISLCLKHGGKGLAIAGIVCGGVGLALSIFIVAAIGLSSTEILEEIENGNFDSYF